MQRTRGTAPPRRRRARIVVAFVAAMLPAQVLVTATAQAGPDTPVNDPSTDSGDSTTQSETSLAFGSGVFCAGYNDFGPNGLSGYASSDDLGATWTDRGGLNERGDPVIVHHTASDTFYYASLGNTSIRVQSSTDGCQTFGAAVNASQNLADTTLADKPWIAVDNTGGATDGNLYVCWTRFFTGGSEMRVVRSTDGGATWLNEQIIAANGTGPFGCSIVVASDGSVSVVWADRNDNDIDFRRSTDAGQTWSAAVQVNSAGLRHPGTDRTVTCGGGNRPTLNGDIRQLHQAWMAVDDTGGPNDGNLYVVYASDPVGATDNADVFYSRSTDDGATWSAQVQIGTGGGATDQFVPNVAVADNGDVGIMWNDRRNDQADNLAIDVYTTFSNDGGASFGALERVTDQSFGMPSLNPNFNPGAAQCYMGEYNAIVGQGGGFYYLWGDNRNTVTNASWPSGRPDPDVFFDALPGPSNVSPAADVQPAAGAEGSAIALQGSAADPDGDHLLYSWQVTPTADVDPGATCDVTDGETLSPTVTCSDDGTYTITLAVTGDLGGTIQDEATLTISNVAPTTTATTTDAAIDEGDSYLMGAVFSDPGWNDTYTAFIDWGVAGEVAEAVTAALTSSGPPADQGTVSGSRAYGDDGTFTVAATVSDDDGGSGTDTVVVTVNNVAPTAEIDTAGTLLINGVDTLLANVGDAVPFAGRTTDPGSDDLTLAWDWDDGSPEPDVVVDSRVDPPNADGSPSPDVAPRDVTDDRSNVFDQACRYDVGFSSTDDDGGSASDSLLVLLLGNDDLRRTAGFWAHQYGGRGKVAFDDAQLLCFLEIVDAVSVVFSEERPATNIAEARAVLSAGSSDMLHKLDRQLLTGWLNFTNGSVAWDTLIDTDGDGTGDTTFADVMATAESVRVDPASTRSELEAQAALIERINHGLA